MGSDVAPLVGTPSAAYHGVEHSITCQHDHAETGGNSMTKTAPEGIRRETRTIDEQEVARIKELTSTPEATELKQKLATAYQILAQKGLDDGVAGHISLRVPGAPEYFWVNPFGLLFCEVTADNLVVVNERGEIVLGEYPINLAGFLIHSAIHHARPDVDCAAHTHPPAGSAFSALKRILEPLDQTCCSFYDDQGLYDEYTGIVIDEDQTDGIVNALGNNRTLILANHGLLTTATTVEQALIDMLDMERSCRLHLDALATGQPLYPVPEEAALNSKAVLTQEMRYPFQWQALVRDLERWQSN